MPPLASDVVEWDLLLQVVWAALAAGVGVTLAMSFAIVGATRWTEASRDGRLPEQIAYALLFALGLAACLGAAVFGIVIMTSKG